MNSVKHNLAKFGMWLPVLASFCGLAWSISSLVGLSDPHFGEVVIGILKAIGSLFVVGIFLVTLGILGDKFNASVIGSKGRYLSLIGVTLILHIPFLILIGLMTFNGAGILVPWFYGIGVFTIVLTYLHHISVEYLRQERMKELNKFQYENL